MSQAEALLSQAARSGKYTASPATEPHIVIGQDRVITVPDELKRLGVQFDHNIETVVFDCPRYWDDTDMSTMNVYVNFERRDRARGTIQAENIYIDEADDTMMHFEWTITKFVTMLEGELKFNVCVKRVDEEGEEVEHWNSELCEECYISEGLEAGSFVESSYPDVLTFLRVKMDNILTTGMPVDVTMEKVGTELVVRIVTPENTEYPEEFRIADGLTPYVGENGHWWIGDEDTGALASPSSDTFMGKSTYDPQGKATDIFQYVHDHGVSEEERLEWDGKMSPAMYDPQGKATDVFQYVHEHGVAEEDREKWDNKSNFSGDYNDLLNKPTIPAATEIVNSVEDESTDKAASAAALKQVYELASNALVGTISSGSGDIAESNYTTVYSDSMFKWYAMGDLLFIYVKGECSTVNNVAAYCQLNNITPLKSTNDAGDLYLAPSIVGTVESYGSGSYSGPIGVRCRCYDDGVLDLDLLLPNDINPDEYSASFEFEGWIVGLCKGY